MVGEHPTLGAPYQPASYAFTTGYILLSDVVKMVGALDKMVEKWTDTTKYVTSKLLKNLRTCTYSLAWDAVAD